MPNPASQTPTDREMEALRAYLAAGSIKGAARQLGRSEQTIKNQLSSLRRRLRVGNTAQAIASLGLRLE